MDDDAQNSRQSHRAADQPARDVRLPYAAWAWEYLRRNSDYARDYRSSLAGRARPIPLNTGAILIRKSRRWSEAEKWGLLCFADPERSCDEANVFWRPDLFAGALPIQTVRIDDAESRDPNGRHDEIELRRLQTRRVILDTVDGARHIVLCGRRFWVQLVCDSPASVGERCAIEVKINSTRHYQRKLDTASQLLSLYHSAGGKISLIGRSRDSTRLSQGLIAIDIVNAGGSHRDVAEAIYGAEKVAERWGGESRYYEDWARRLVARARFMVNEGYLDLLAKKTL